MMYGLAKGGVLGGMGQGQGRKESSPVLVPIQNAREHHVHVCRCADNQEDDEEE